MIDPVFIEQIKPDIESALTATEAAGKRWAASAEAALAGTHPGGKKWIDTAKALQDAVLLEQGIAQMRMIAANDFGLLMLQHFVDAVSYGPAPEAAMAEAEDAERALLEAEAAEKSLNG